MRQMRTTNFFVIAASLLLLLATLLAGAAWYITSQYRLNFFSAIPIITAILGPVDFATMYRSAASLSTSRRTAKRPLPPLMLFLNLLLLLLPSVMIALGAPYLGDSKCQMEQTWHGWYSAHDAKAIKGIQDSLQCCGFGNVKQMPFPFFKNPLKDKNGTDIPDTGVPATTCQTVFRHDNPCAPLWQGELRTAAGLVVAAGALMLALRFIFLMIILGYPSLSERWFGTPIYNKHQAIENNHRAIGEVEEDDEEDGDDEEGRARRILAVEERQSEDNDVNERSGLLMPKANGGNDYRAALPNDQPWQSEAEDRRRLAVEY